MVHADLKTFFLGSAGVAGALIGLLFVAITVAQEQLAAPDAAQAHRVRASAALTAFINALTVSLFALLPGTQIGGAALTLGVLGLLFIAASLISLLRVRRSQPGQLREALFLVGFAVTFGLQVVYGAQVAANARDTSSVHDIAVLVVVCFLIGIARAWELVGGPSIGLRGELTAAARSRLREKADGPPDARP